MNETDEIRSHLAGFWPGHETKEFSWTLGPIQESLPSFRVCRIAPFKRTDPWVYASVGASSVGTPSGFGYEFFLLAPTESPRHVETLAMVAHYHATAELLDVGSTVRIGRGWVDGRTCDHLLVSLPYPYGPAFEFLRTDNSNVRFLWLLPVYQSEVEFLHREGLEALEQAFDEREIDAIDPRRPAVA